MEYNIYCDESCHLEHDGINSMSIGAIYYNKEISKEISDSIIRIKERYGITKTSEVKWVKLSPKSIDLYKSLIDYYFNNSHLHFRVVVIKDKQNLNHKKYNQTHDEWYYKMYFEMLRYILSPNDKYNIYLDIKDSQSYYKCQELMEFLRNDKYDFNTRIIKKVQPIRSHEVQIMQLVDILVGAVAYANREFDDSIKLGNAKREIVEYIKELSNYSLTKTTLLREEKMNILAWEAKNGL